MSSEDDDYKDEHEEELDEAEKERRRRYVHPASKPRFTNEELEIELNAIYKLIIQGIPSDEIIKIRNITKRNFADYKSLLRDRIIAEQMEKRAEYFIMDMAKTEEGINRDRRTFLKIMNDPKAPAIAKVTAAKEDRDTLALLLKLSYEGSIYINSIKRQMIKENSQPLNINIINNNVMKEEEEKEDKEDESG